MSCKADKQARDRYEGDCVKLNSFTANKQLVQGRELDKLESKIDRVKQTISSNENDFRNFVSVLEQTNAKWENDWRNFCDTVQDLEEERMHHTKDIVWAYANAVSQVCVEDDSVSFLESEPELTSSRASACERTLRASTP